MMKLKIVLAALIASAALVSVASAHSCEGHGNKAESGCRSEVKARKSGCGTEAKARKSKCGSEAKAKCGSAKVAVEAEAPVEAVE